MDYQEIINKLKSMSDPKNIEGMARFGINPDKILGISIPPLRQLAKEINKDPNYASSSAKASDDKKAPLGKHQLALEIWDSGYHEARILASMIDDASLVTKEQMDKWAADFDSWDVCDQTCMNLFVYSDFALEKAIEWSTNNHEFVKRAGFALMACMAWKLKKATDESYNTFFSIIIKESTDERNFVKKAVNWALRQIGKKNTNLNSKSLAIAYEILEINSKSAKWIAKDAIKELESKAVQARLKASDKYKK